jgi:hypothetical protein
MSAKPAYQPRCKFLYCKSMLVYGDSFESDPEYQAGITDFWCQCTSKALGPDGEHVALEECSNPQRECYREY